MQVPEVQLGAARVPAGEGPPGLLRRDVVPGVHHAKPQLPRPAGQLPGLRPRRLHGTVRGLGTQELPALLRLPDLRRQSVSSFTSSLFSVFSRVQ